MTSSPSAGSSDLEKARALSKSLEAARSPEGTRAGFIAFRRPGRREPAGMPSPPPRVEAPPAEAAGVQTSPPLLPAFGARRWDLLTAWLRAWLEADAGLQEAVWTAVPGDGTTIEVHRPAS